MTAIEQAEVANERLEKLYEPWLVPWREMRAANPAISIPMFLEATPAYFASQPRIVFVGQETHGWWTTCKIPPSQLTARPVMDFYQGVEMTDYRIKSASPFLRAAQQMGSYLGQVNYPAPLLTANLFPCDVNKTQAPEALLKAMQTWKLLPAELEILAPQVVVFFAGPTYSGSLWEYFGTSVEPKLSSKNLFASYQPPGQPWQGWVTYHPGYLRRSRQWAVLDVLAESIRQHLA
jgi:hypothetical protein